MRLFCSSRIKTVIRGIRRLDELYHLVSLPGRIKAVNSPRCIMHLVPISIRNEQNRRPKYVRLISSQTDYAFHIVLPSLHLTKKIADV